MDIIAFHNAVCAGDLEKIKKYFAEHKHVTLNNNFVFMNKHIFTLPLIHAFEEKHWDVARYLINAGADLDVVCQKRNKTPREFMPEDFEL